MCSALILPVIASERLILRRPQTSDAKRIAELCNDYEIPRMTTRMPWPYGLLEAQFFIDMMQERDPAIENAFLIDMGGEVVGCVGLFMQGRHPEIGYWIGRDYWGQGIATEATKAALKWARTDWRKKVVVAGHFADNPASGMVLTKVGFLYTGEVEKRFSVARGEDALTRMMVWIA